MLDLVSEMAMANGVEQSLSAMPPAGVTGASHTGEGVPPGGTMRRTSGARFAAR